MRLCSKLRGFKVIVSYEQELWWVTFVVGVVLGGAAKAKIGGTMLLELFG